MLTGECTAIAVFASVTCDSVSISSFVSMGNGENEFVRHSRLENREQQTGDMNKDFVNLDFLTVMVIHSVS